jgi:hypothetical protein
MHPRPSRTRALMGSAIGLLALLHATSLPPVIRPAATTAAAASFDGFAQAGGAATAIAIHGGVAYAGIGASLALFDVTDPLHPALLPTTLPLPDVAEDLAIDNGFLFAVTRETGGTGNARLLTFDLGEPRAPRPLGAGLTLPVREIGAIAVAFGDIVLAGEQGVLIVDTKDPAAPRLIARVPTGTPAGRRPWAADIAIDGDGLAWIARPWGLYTVDLANPTPSGVVERHRRPTRGIAAAGGLVFALTESGSIEVWLGEDLADEATRRIEIRPEERATRAPVVLDGLASAPRAIAAAGDQVLVIDHAGRRLRAFDARTPAELRLRDEVWIAAQDSERAALALADGAEADDDLAADAMANGWPADDRIADGVLGIVLERGGVLTARAGDFSNIGRPAVPIAPPIIHTHLAAGYAFASAEAAGFYVLDLADPALPRVVGALQVVAEAGRADPVASDPSRPDPAGLRPDARAVAFRSAIVQDDVAFACTAQDGVFAIDVGSPADLRVLGRLPEAPACYPGTNLAYRDGTVYLTTADRRLAVVDVADPRAMRLVSAAGAGGIHDITTLAVEGDHLYATGYAAITAGVLYVLDLSDPARPRRVAGLDFNQAYAKLAVAYRRVFLSGSFGSVAIVDFMPPANLIQRPTYTGIVAGQLGLYDTLVYAAGSGHLDTMLTSTSGTLFPLSRVALPWAGEDWVGESDVKVAGGRVAILRGRAGLFTGTGPDGVVDSPMDDPGPGGAPAAAGPPSGTPSVATLPSHRDAAVAPCTLPRHVILVADTSSDMADPFDTGASDGPAALRAAIAAFIGSADLDAVEIGIGRYDRQGEFVMSSGAPSTLLGAWDSRSGMDSRTGGRADLGLDVAYQALRSGLLQEPQENELAADPATDGETDRISDAHTGAVILLAAGTPNSKAQRHAADRAALLAAAGIPVHAVAIGPFADARFLGQLAGAPERRHRAADAGGLAELLGRLGRELTRCP